MSAVRRPRLVGTVLEKAGAMLSHLRRALGSRVSGQRSASHRTPTTGERTRSRTHSLCKLVNETMSDGMLPTTSRSGESQSSIDLRADIRS